MIALSAYVRRGPECQTLVKMVCMYDQGGPEVLRWEERELPAPGPGQIRLKLTASAVNFSDINNRYGRWGFSPRETWGMNPHERPFVLGLEAAGTIEEMGPDVSGFHLGQRICFGAGGGRRAYAEAANIPVEAAIPIPDGVDERIAAASIMKGMAVRTFLKDAYRLNAGEVILVHAAAGAMGHILCQWAKHLGATVIGTVGSEEKAAFALSHGCDHAFVYGHDDVLSRVKAITDARGVSVVYDGVGQDLVRESLGALGKRGMFLNYGQTSGPDFAISPKDMMYKSLYYHRPMMHDYIITPKHRADASRDFFDVLLRGVVKPAICQTYALREAAQAHRDKEARRSIGATLLIP